MAEEKVSGFSHVFVTVTVEVVVPAKSKDENVRRVIEGAFGEACAKMGGHSDWAVTGQHFVSLERWGANGGELNG